MQAHGPPHPASVTGGGPRRTVRRQLRAVNVGLAAPDGKTGAGEEVVRGIVEAPAGTDVPLDIVAHEPGEAAVKIVLWLCGLRGVRKEGEPPRS